MDMDIDVDIDMRVSENEVTAPKQLLFTGRLNIYIYIIRGQFCTCPHTVCKYTYIYIYIKKIDV